jgi:DNA-binding NtrC family response regulator
VNHDQSIIETNAARPCDGSAYLTAPSAPLVDIIRARSVERWGEGQATNIIGAHASITAAVQKAARYARSDSPVMINGATGTGKELFARAIYLLSPRYGAPYTSVNCAQYQEGQLIASELFGHRRGSFTGAMGDHRGIFESAEGGVVFLDEVGELSLQAQAMLLRLLSEGEIVPVGETKPRRVNVRVVVATHRNLRQMVDQGTFRADLYYRLRYLHLHIPPVCERGDDWELILDHYLSRLAGPGRPRKRFSEEALALLSAHRWPGNVREIRGLVDTGYHLSDGPVIEPADFGEALEDLARTSELAAVPVDEDRATPALFDRVTAGSGGTFWEIVHEPYLQRDLNRAQVRALITRGLQQTRGSYKRLLELFRLPQQDYLKFMDFLRHHDLKPAD